MTLTLASFSGGKDSTAMVLRMIERGERLDDRFAMEDMGITLKRLDDFFPMEASE